MKLKIRQIEEYTTYIVRDSIVIDTENFEQLKGLSQEQAIAYIQDNYDELYPDEGTEWEPHFSYKYRDWETDRKSTRLNSSH